MLEIQLISILLGVIVGLVLALTGAGGAILAVPLLVYGLDLSITESAPIALLAVFLASTLGAIQGLVKGIVRYKTATMIALFGILFAPVGVIIAQHISQAFLNISFACVLIFVALQIWKNTAQAEFLNHVKIPPACAINPVNSKLFWTASCTKRLIATGSVAGLLSGLLGVGGGFVIVPSLNKVSNFDAQTIIATTLASVALISLSSLASHLHQFQVQWTIAIPFVLSTTFAMLILSVWRDKIPNQISQKSFAVLCVLAAGYLVGLIF